MSVPQTTFDVKFNTLLNEGLCGFAIDVLVASDVESRKFLKCLIRIVKTLDRLGDDEVRYKRDLRNEVDEIVKDKFQSFSEIEFEVLCKLM